MGADDSVRRGARGGVCKARSSDELRQATEVSDHLELPARSGGGGRSGADSRLSKSTEVAPAVTSTSSGRRGGSSRSKPVSVHTIVRNPSSSQASQQQQFQQQQQQQQSRSAGEGSDLDIELELKGQALYKTELCRSYETTGICRYADRCQFAHGREELRPVLRHPKYKTEVCRTYTAQGTCPYGVRCRFIHYSKANEVGQNSVILPTQLDQQQMHQIKELVSTSRSGTASSANSSPSESPRVRLPPEEPVAVSAMSRPQVRLSQSASAHPKPTATITRSNARREDALRNRSSAERLSAPADIIVHDTPPPALSHSVSSGDLAATRRLPFFQHLHGKPVEMPVPLVKPPRSWESTI